MPFWISQPVGRNSPTLRSKEISAFNEVLSIVPKAESSRTLRLLMNHVDVPEGHYRLAVVFLPFNRKSEHQIVHTGFPPLHRAMDSMRMVAVMPAMKAIFWNASTAE